MINKNTKVGAHRFVYIFDKQHGCALISPQKFEQIKNILYGTNQVEES